MKYGISLIALLLLSGGIASAQGVSQSPTTTVTQQRQGGSLVSGGPSTAVKTNQGISTGFGSPFSSPFGTPTNTQTKGGYAGNNVKR
jgi:hypothetical protein